MIGKIDDASFRVPHEELIRFDHEPPLVRAPPTEPKRNPLVRDAETMPAGVMRWPPPRPEGYELRRVAPARIIQAIHALETKPAWLVHAAHSVHAAPADRLFAVWFRVLDWLGTRTLTMGEMSRLLSAHSAGQSATGEDRVVKTLVQIDKADTGLKSFGDLCKFAGALSGDALASQGPLLFAVLRAGEAGAFVEAPDQPPEETDKVVLADVVVFKEFVVAGLPPPVLSPGAIFWSSITPRLSQAPVDLIVGLIDSFSESDASREQEKRIDAFTPAPEPVPAPSQRARPAAVSVSRMTAHIQLAQVLHRHLKLDQPGARVDVRDPDAKLDLVDAYRLYRQLIDDRQLTSCQTVEAWLVGWGVARAP